MLILQINWSADADKGRSARGAHCHQSPRLSTFDKQFLQIHWGADSGKGPITGGAHSYQPPHLSIFDKQFLLKCLFFRSTGAQTQPKRAVRVAHTSTLVLIPLINSFC
jgi:hypothetical protein